MRQQSASNPPRIRVALDRATVTGVVAASVLAWAVLVLPQPFSIAVVPTLTIGVLLLAYPALAPVALVASVPVQDVGAVSFGGQTLTATKVAVATVAVMLPLVVAARRQKVHVPAIAVGFVLYLLAQVASLSAARDLGAGVAEIYRWGVALLAFLAVVHLVRNMMAVIALAGVVAAATVGEVTLGTLQAVLGIAPESFAVGGGLFRAYGTFGKPNPYAGYLEMTTFWLIPLAVWALWQFWQAMADWRTARQRGYAASRRERVTCLGYLALVVWLAAASTIGLIGIGLSFSRGAWLGAAAATGVLLLSASRRLQVAALVLGLVGGLFLLGGGAVLLPDALRERALQLTTQLRLFDVRDVQLTDETFAAIERMTHWQAGLAMARDYPWTGVGVGNYNARFAEYSPHPLFRISRGHAHNYYIHALAETGILGLAAYLVLVLLTLRTALRAARTRDRPLARALGIGALGATTAVVVHNVVETLHALNLSVQLAAIWAAAWVAADGDLRGRSSPVASGEEPSP